MKKFIYLLLCSGMLVACSKQSDGTNAASATKSASEVHTTASAAEGKKQVAASTEVSAAKQGEIDPAVLKQFDGELAQIQKQLPRKMTNALEFTSMERRGNKVYYSYTLKDSKMNSKLFNKAAAEQLLKNSCQESNTKRLLKSGLEFVYIYHFEDKSEITLSLTGKDCQ